MNGINWYQDPKSILEYLAQRDDKLIPVIRRFGAPAFRNEEDYFMSLLRSIVHQQLSGKAAGAIYTRLRTFFKNEHITPSMILSTKDQDLRKLGLSKSKTSYAKTLAEAFRNDEIPQVQFRNMTDEDRYIELMKLKGIGRGTVDMFLIFTLKRPDVFPKSDSGIRRGFQILYNLDERPNDELMGRKSERWRPFRTVVSRYLWMIVDNGLNKEV